MIPYRELLARLALHHVPPQIVARHLTRGLKDGEVCGGCEHFREIHRSPKRLADEGPVHYCGQCFTVENLPETTPACGAWRAREGWVTEPRPHSEQLALGAE